MFVLKKESGIAISTEKPVQFIVQTKSLETPYFLLSSDSLSISTVTGRKLRLYKATSEDPILSVSVSEKKNLIAILSSRHVTIWSQLIKNYKKIEVPKDFILESSQGSGIEIDNEGVIVICSYSKNCVWRPGSLNGISSIEGSWTLLNSDYLRISLAGVAFRRIYIADSTRTSRSHRGLLQEPSLATVLFGSSIRFSDGFYRGKVASVLKVRLCSQFEEVSALEGKYSRVALDSSNCHRLEEVKFKTNIEFILDQYESGMLVKLDNQGSLAALVLNSAHSFYCQLMFINPVTSKTISQS